MRSGLSTLRFAVVVMLLASPGLAFARRTAWGRQAATAESTGAAIDRQAGATASSLRAQFGAAVASAVDETLDAGRARRTENAAVSFQSSRDEQRVDVESEAGEGVLVTRSRGTARTKNGTAIHGTAMRREADGSTQLRQRSVITDGKRKPRTVMFKATDSRETAGGSFERTSNQVFTRSRWGGDQLEQAESSETRVGAFASEGNQLEQTSSKVWGRGKFKQTQRRTVANNGQERLVNSTSERKLGGLITVHKAEGFATHRNGKMKQVGTSRQVTFGGKTLNLGRQRADRAPPARWAPRGATASAGPRFARR